MKYAIKEENGVQFVRQIEPDGYFLFTKDVNEAKQFDSIAGIVKRLAQRARQQPIFSIEYTIVGVKEINTPRYEEVVL